MSRRHDDLRLKPSIVPSKDRRDDLDEEMYFAARRGGGGGGGREELMLRSRRSVSPQDVVERGRRTMGRDRRSTSLERRREYERHIDRGRGVGAGGDGHVLSRSPQMERPQKRVYMDERVFVASPTSMRIQGNLGYVDYNNSNTRPRNAYSFEDVEDVKPKDYPARRSGASGHRPLVESAPFEDAVNRDVGLHPVYGYATKLVEPCGNYSTIDMHRVKDEKARYQDLIFHEKMVKDVYYKGGEQSAYYTRESPIIDSPVSQIKDFGSEELLKNNPSTSSGIMVRGENITKLRDGSTLPSDGYPNCYGKDLEILDSDDYGQRVISDTMRGYGAICRDAKCHACDAYCKDHRYPEIGASGVDEIAYASKDILHAKIKYAREEHDPRDFLRQDIMDSSVERIANIEGHHSSRRIIKNVGAREYDAVQKEMARNYMDTRRSSNALIQAGNYLDSGYPHVELTRKISNHRHVIDLGSLHEHEFEDPHLGNGYGRYAPTGSDRIRMKNTSDFKHLQMQRIAEGFERIEADDPVDNFRVLKRKYVVDEDVGRVESRGNIGSKWNIQSGTDDFHDHLAQWAGRKANIMHSKRSSGYERNHYVESEDIFDGSYYENSTNVGWTSYQDQSESVQEHSDKPFKMRNRHFKGYTKPESSKSSSYVHHSHQRSTQYKQQNFSQKDDNENSTAIPEVGDILNTPVGPWKSEPSEDSDGFKQRIQTAYLDFSKRFNENPTARKLYKEEGKAGSLFCVVCRRSASKEFLNTKALAAHAFMSHKVGLRPQHLGLHRAICVLMGWNTMPDPDTGTWAPELLPKPEALAQKEDLILWPPVVIVHNFSLSNNDHNKWKLINIDALGEFLRGKGFHLGKMKICLGNPGDHSVILVKFLGTFSGLQEAERLHKLFIERNHGRIDFDQAISGSGPTDELLQGSDESEKLEDVLLYGYLGISEDLDSVDFDTKKRCLVKSKKDIHELADAPVKPELLT